MNFFTDFILAKDDEALAISNTTIQRKNGLTLM